MATRWTRLHLGEVITLQRGFDLPERQRMAGDVPIVSSSGISGYHSEAKVSPPGVVTGRYGTLGEVFYVDVPFWPLNTTLWVKDFKGNCPQFISYLLRTLHLGAQNAAGAVPGLNRNALHLLPVLVPPPPTQERIASILSAYDDLIENNARRIKILEEIAKVIYREWFVDFRFPGHKKVAVVNSSGLVGPEGWERTVVERACVSVDDGDWIETKDQGGDSYRLLQVSNIGLNAFVETDNYRFVSAETFQRLRCREVLPGDILVARMPTPIGRAWLVTPQAWRMITAVDVAILKAKEGNSLFLLHFLNSAETLATCSAQASGTTRERITRKQIAALPVLLPPEAVRVQFAGIVEPINELMDKLQNLNRKLSQTRNLLLPKLISGEVSVERFETEPVAQGV